MIFYIKVSYFKVGYIITHKSDLLNEAAQNTTWVPIRYFDRKKKSAARNV
jgi:hypothetical protein